ncbi:MAG: HDIG domain-containing protein [Parachlamydiales bacterium]|nr:HDIG domain-containing protein [Parachlamydiales bacterium]
MGDYSPGNDPSSTEEEFKELGGVAEQGYFDKSLSIRCLIAIFLGLSIFLFFHFREARVAVLEINGQAASYVVTPVDFQFLDEEATLIQKQDAVRGIGKIFRFDENDVNNRGDAFEKYLVTDLSWDKFSPSTTLEEMYYAVNLFEDVLIQSRYTDARTLQKIKELQQPTNIYHLFIPPKDSTNPIDVPNALWNILSDQAFSNHNIHKTTATLIIDYFKQVPWKFNEDISTEKMLQKKAQNLVADKYTQVSSGSRIIEQGQKITGRHISMVESMRKALNDSRELWRLSTLAGSIIIAGMIVLLGGFYLRLNHADIFYSNRKLFLYATIVVLTLLLAKATEFFLLQGTSRLIALYRYPLFAPFAAILICSLLNARMAIFTSACLSIILSITLAVDQGAFLIVNLLTSMVAILTAKAIHKRKAVFLICLNSWLCSIPLVFGFDLYDVRSPFATMLTDIFSTFLFMTFTGILIVGILPLLESIFHVMTDITLMEFMDPSNELLRRLTIEAPGTYQHSIVVGNLAEYAARAIGANGLFCRVATQYHDVGKLIAPQYFTENQQSGVNMHQLLTPHESAQVIISHVSEGVGMARKAGLPEQFIDIIKEHHGTTLVYYFFHKQRELVNGDVSLIEEKDFRYSGPKPHSKESAIIMIADTLEAASRSLDEFTEENVTRLVDRLIAEKADDGQFDECQLTFIELGIVKKTMIKILVTAGHSRVKYPPKLKHS